MGKSYRFKVFVETTQADNVDVATRKSTIHAIRPTLVEAVVAAAIAKALGPVGVRVTGKSLKAGEDTDGDQSFE